MIFDLFTQKSDIKDILLNGVAFDYIKQIRTAMMY